MFDSLKKKFVIEDGFCIATEVVEHDKKNNPSNRVYPTYMFEGEEIVKYKPKGESKYRHYRHRRFVDLASSDELAKLGITAQDIVRKCQGPIKILKKRSSLDH